MCVCVLMNNN